MPQMKELGEPRDGCSLPHAGTFREDDADRMRAIAWKNRPSRVFGEIALVVCATTAFVVAINAVLSALHIAAP